MTTTTAIKTIAAKARHGRHVEDEEALVRRHPARGAFLSVVGLQPARGGSVNAIDLVAHYVHGTPAERTDAAARLELLAAATVEIFTGAITGRDRLRVELSSARAELAEVRAEMRLHVEAAVRAASAAESSHADGHEALPICVMPIGYVGLVLP